MPILIPADESIGLEQGDLLGGLRLYSTGGDDEQKPKLAAHQLALVLSRPCVAVNKPRIVVAVVEPGSHQLPGELRKRSLEEIAKVLTKVRDADGSDSFYLGEIPGGGEPQRYKASLDFIVTLTVPEDHEARAKWTKEHRRARLHPDFRRDLHTRLFLSIAKQGFDDLGWLSDGDLSLIVEIGKSKVSAATAQIDDAKAAVAQAHANGSYKKEHQGLEKTLAGATTGLEKIRNDLLPYEAELERRKVT